MPDPILSDEEMDARLSERLSDPMLDASERRALRAEHDAVMADRRRSREAAQEHYDSGKGRSGAGMFKGQDGA